jgi:ABC-type antimicrobial peptide transport system permease subunit
MTSAQALLIGAIIGSGIGVFAGSSHILPALRALRTRIFRRR